MNTKRTSIVALTGCFAMPLWAATGTGQVYIPNQFDDPALQPVVLTGLDASGFLRGTVADVTNSLTNRAFSAVGDFTFDPNVQGDPRIHFAETMAYHHVTDFNNHVATLGFTTAQFPLPIVVFAAQPQGPLMFPIPTHYDPDAKMLYLAATIDMTNSEALDGDVIIHTYAHAIQHDLLGGALGPFVAPDVTLTQQGAALMEAIADYLAASHFGDAQIGETQANLISGAAYARSVENFRVWPRDFTAGASFSTSLIWSGALWDLRGVISADVVDQLVLAMIPLIPDNDPQTPELNTTFDDALAALQQADSNAFAGAHATQIAQAFAVRGIGSFNFATGFAAEIDPGNNFDATQVEQITGADRVAVRFDQFVTRLDDLPFSTTVSPLPGTDDKTTRDELTILDAADNVVGVFSGRQLQGATIIVPGDTAKFHLTTDAVIPPLGYRVLSVLASIPGDNDADGDVDLIDYAALADCFFGPNITPIPTPPMTAAQCIAVFDFDADQDVDLEDAAAFQIALGQG